MGISSSGQVIGRAFGPRVRLVLFFLLTWLGIAVLLVFLLNEGRKEAEQKAPADALAVTAVLEARLEAVLRRLQGNLEHLAASLPKDALQTTSLGRYRDGVSAELDLISGMFPEICGFVVTDASGKPLYASRRSNSSPEFIGHDQVYGPSGVSDKSLLFSDVLVDRRTGESSLMVIKPVFGADEALVGRVIALLDLGTLAKVFETVQVGPKGVMSIWRTDLSQLILRLPALPDQVNRVAADNPLQRRIDAGDKVGTMRISGMLDGVDRIYAFQRVAEFPFYVASGLAVDDYLAGWRQTLWVAGVSSLLLFLSLSLVLIRLLRAENEEEFIASKLAESEARYRMLAENSHDVIWTIDIPSRRYTYISPSITDMCGYLPDEIVGQSIDSRLTPESAARLARDIDQRLRRIAAGDKSASVVVSEQEQICKDGEVVTTEVVSSYLLDADGVAQTILGITRNVSERKAAELALRETNRQLHARIEEIGRLQVALQELAVRDSLTALYNRRYLDETLEREVSRTRREGTPLSLVMLDIDYFKQVNDTYGHQVGDEVLRMLAGILTADIRAEDVACRYGGEEFLILLPNMPLESALQRAEAWRMAIEKRSVTLGNHQIAFTISLGVAAYPEHGKTPDDLTRCADQALYRAKHEGRNRVCVFSA